MDHVVAKGEGGIDRRSNIVPACPPCNNMKDKQSISRLITHDPEESTTNYQTFFNDIAEMVNNKEKNEDYLLSIVSTIKSEAGGLLDIKIEKIDDNYVVKVINKLEKEQASA